MYHGLYVMYNMCSIFSFLAIFTWNWILVFHCVTSSGHEVKLRKHGHGVIMRSSLCVTGLGGMDTGVAAESEEQRLAREAQAKAMQDQQAEMEAKAKADQQAQWHLPPPPFRPLAEQSFMQYMQFMQETQNKFMQELMGQIGAGGVS
jgi:hypothetical protein